MQLTSSSNDLLSNLPGALGTVTVHVVAADGSVVEIGRASCRERVFVGV